MMTLLPVRRAVVPCAALALAAVIGCSIDEQKPPSVTGPSEFGLSLAMDASPDQVVRDGSSQSTFTVTARDPQGQPVADQRLAIALVFPSPLGTSLSASEVVTGGDGRASVTVTAPPRTTPGDRITLEVRPANTSIDAEASRRFSIGVTPSNPSAPVADFTFLPADPIVGQAVSFDASSSRDEGLACSLTCSYSWDFGDGTSGTGVVASHQFSAGGTALVTLTVADALGATGSVTKAVPVTTPAPTTVGTISVSPTPVKAGVTAFFATTSPTVGTGVTVLDYTWVWGDGTDNTVSVTPQASHQYATEGTYTVTLTVRDSLGRSVTAPPLAVEVEAP